MAKPNMHPTYCPACMVDVGEEVDLGVSDHVFKCYNCQNHYLGPVWPGACPVCLGKPGKQRHITRILAWVRVPGKHCQECFEKELAVNAEIVAGGVGFQCTNCGHKGAYSANTDFAKRVRDGMRLQAPEEVRVQIDKCPRCMNAQVHDDAPGPQQIDEEEYNKEVAYEKEVDVVSFAIESAAFASEPEVPVDALEN